MVDCGHYRIKDENGNEFIFHLENKDDIPSLSPVGSSRRDFSVEFVWSSEVQESLRRYEQKNESVFSKFNEAYRNCVK